MPSLAPSLVPSRLVRVTQTVRTRDAAWQTQIEGRVISCSPAPTGSWFAHGKDGRLWLQRLRIEKAGGEIVDLVLDGNSTVTLLELQSKEV